MLRQLKLSITDAVIVYSSISLNEQEILLPADTDTWYFLPVVCLCVTRAVTGVCACTLQEEIS